MTSVQERYKDQAAHLHVLELQKWNSSFFLFATRDWDGNTGPYCCHFKGASWHLCRVQIFFIEFEDMQKIRMFTLGTCLFSRRYQSWNIAKSRPHPCTSQNSKTWTLDCWCQKSAEVFIAAVCVCVCKRKPRSSCVEKRSNSFLLAWKAVTRIWNGCAGEVSVHGSQSTFVYNFDVNWGLFSTDIEWFRLRVCGCVCLCV